jgi:hypothetical protein
MGYIAPIPQHQYKQYAEREMTKGYDPFKFVPITKINIKSKLVQKENSRLQQKFSRKEKYPAFVNEKIKQVPSTSPDFLSELTGKGQFFHEYV